MLRLYPQITFTKANGRTYIFPFVTECETEESYENLTDTFKITLPRNLTLEGKQLFNGVAPIFERGDRVKVELGYFPTLRTVFEGWVSDIGAKIPVEITCEDDMWLLKNTSVTYPSKDKLNITYLSKKKGKPLKRPKVISPNITLKQLLDNILPADIEYSEPILDVNLGQFRVSNASVAKVLEEFKSKCGLFSYFRGGLLYVGLPSNAADTVTQEFEFENNIIDDSELEFQLEKDISVKVVAKLLGLNNTFEEVEVGDTDGAQRTFHLYWDGKSPKPNLKEFAELKLDESRYDGYVGSFETFGEPYVRHGDVVKLTSKTLPERNGSYLVTSVKRKFGMSGYRQIIEIGAKVSGF
jgi:hypothetical protein